MTTRVIATCATILGCELEDDSGTTTLNNGECALPTPRPRGLAAAAAGLVRRQGNDWACDTPEKSGLIYPKDTSKFATIQSALEERKNALGEAYTFNAIKSTTQESFLIFFHVDRLGPQGGKILAALGEVSKP